MYDREVVSICVMDLVAYMFSLIPLTKESALELSS